MSSALDMSLDDIIKTNKKSGAPNPRSRQRNSGPGPSRRIPNRRPNRPAPYSNQERIEAPDTTWRHDMFTEEAAPRAYRGQTSSVETGTKLYISNLDFGVSNEDIQELFGEFGNLKKYSIHYDRSGRSKGVAEVVFSRRADALEAVKRYNNVELDGKPMKIEIVTPATAPAPPAANGLFGNRNGAHRSSGSQGKGGVPGQPSGGGSGGGRRRGRGRKLRGGRDKGGTRTEKVSAEDLDADLDKYHAEMMQVS